MTYLECFFILCGVWLLVFAVGAAVCTGVDAVISARKTFDKEGVNSE